MKIVPRKIIITALFFILSAGLFISIAHTTQAQVQPSQYTPLAPITAPGASVSTSNLTSFLIDLIRVTIAASAALAVLMVIFGGIQYMSTDAFSGKSDARKRITNALFGFLLVMISYLVLRTINPALVDFSIINNDLGSNGATTIPNGSPDQKVVSLGHSGEVGNATVQQYSFKATNGTRYNVTGLKTENLNNLNDTDFYSISIIKNPTTVYYETEAECLANQNQQPAANVMQPCQQTTGGPTLYKETDANGAVAASNESQAVCNQGISGKTGWTCVSYTPIYAISVGLKDSTFTNLTLLACQSYGSTWTQNNPGQTTSQCTKSPLQ